MAASGCAQSDSTAEQYPSKIEELANDRSKRDPRVAAPLRGRAVYTQYCTICHGDDGDGNGFNAAMLNPAPRNFTEPGFWKKRTKAQVSRAIHHGGPAIGKSVLMPAWERTLSERQISDVVAFLQTLKPPPRKPTEESE